MKTIRRYRTPIIAGGVVVAVVAFLLFRPDKLFVDDVVDEPLAAAFTTTTEPGSATTAEPSAPETSGTSMAPEASTTMTETTAAPDTTAGAQSAGPVALTTGSFYGIDHSASGTATIYEQDGRHVLRFEDDTDIQNGPDLYVWVLGASDYGGGNPDEYIDLGRIKGNVGGQNYELPAEFDPAVHRSVLIWCLRFAVPFAAAPLV